jgi:branched-chain amino acid transport system ATP-binding protein
MTPVLELRNVRAGYGTIDVLHGVDLVLQPGEAYALLGPNGAGKTTTLRVCAGQITPSVGQVLINGREVNGASSDALARAGVCLIPEGRGIFPNLTIAENLRMFTHTGCSFNDVQDRAYAQFPRLRERRKQVAGTMSGGEQQMLSMSRALATSPVLLLLDELSMGLAPIIVEELYAVVADLARQGVSILIVEQFAQAVLGVAKVASIMLHGRVDRTGDSAEVAAELASAYLATATTSPHESAIKETP